MFYDADWEAICQGKVWSWISSKLAGDLRMLVEALMEHERDVLVGCAPHERTPGRRGYRNGYEERGLDTRFGYVRLRKPRVRGCAEPWRSRVFERYQRRAREVEDILLYWVSAGMSTRDASRAFERTFHGVLSAGTVSRIVARLDRQIRDFHARPLDHGYHYVYFDAKCGHTCHRRRTRGRGKKKHGALLLAWGVRHSGREELIDFRAVDKENEENWTGFLTDLERRGLKQANRNAQRLEMIVTDGDGGLLESLYNVYPTVPKQRCVFHKIQNIADHLQDPASREAILADAGRIYQDVCGPSEARHRLRRWVQRWADKEHTAVRCFLYDFEQTLTYLTAPLEWQSRVKTNNPIERFIRELDRKFERMGLFPSSASWERAAWLVWQRLKTDGYAPTQPHRTQTTFTRNS